MNRYSEKELISKLSEILHEKGVLSNRNTLLSIGDDSAVYKVAEKELVCSTDSTIKGVHFPKDWSDYSFGWFAATRALSDIAAMGAVPEFLLLCAMLPNNFEQNLIEAYKGLATNLSLHKTVCIGGDVIFAKQFGLSATTIGRLLTKKDTNVKNSILTINSARAGDSIYVSGHLGEFANSIKSNKEPAVSKLPLPQITVGNELVSHGVICATDISDGLIIDLHKVTSASGVSAVVDLTKIPNKECMMETALYGGDDYVLLFTCAQVVSVELPFKHFEIGKIVDDKKNGAISNIIDGKEIPIKGWDSIQNSIIDITKN